MEKPVECSCVETPAKLEAPAKPIRRSQDEPVRPISNSRSHLLDCTLGTPPGKCGEMSQSVLGTHCARIFSIAIRAAVVANDWFHPRPFGSGCRTGDPPQGVLLRQIAALSNSAIARKLVGERLIHLSAMRLSMLKNVLLTLIGLSLAAQTISDGPRFTTEGQLVMPKDYREWVYLSSGLGMTYGPAAQADQGNSMFDNVLVNRSAYRAFLESGRWPDKTMFILEVRRALGNGSINKGGHYQGDVLAVEAAVKDESRFPQKWAYFGFGRSETAPAFSAASECNSCHSQNAAVENTFVQFYPTLLEVATRKGTLNSAYVRRSAKEEGIAHTPRTFRP